MKKNLLIAVLAVISVLGIVQSYRLSNRLDNARYVKDAAIPFSLTTANHIPEPSTNHEMY